VKKIVVFILMIAVLTACTGSPSISNSENKGDQAQANVEITPIVESVKFAKLTMPELQEVLGEPEDIDEWEFKSTNGQTYDAVTWIYDDGNQEFMFIDDKIVRYTMYGTDQTYNDKDHVLALFGITPGPNITKVADTGSAIRYERVDVSMKVDDFWLIEGSEKNSIGTVKITYDSRYF
jgi:hypothetical protein